MNTGTVISSGRAPDIGSCGQASVSETRTEGRETVGKEKMVRERRQLSGVPVGEKGEALGLLWDRSQHCFLFLLLLLSPFFLISPLLLCLFFLLLLQLGLL